MRPPYTHPSDVHRPADQSLTREFSLYSDLLFDAVIGNGLVAIRDHWPHSLKIRIAAAIISNNLGIGMDYALKTYLKDVQYEATKGRLDRKAEGLFFQATTALSDAYAFAKPENAAEQDFFFALAFMKTTSTLEAAHGLTQQGYLAEPMALCRMAIETLAWAIASSLAPDGADFLAISTRKAISKATKEFSTFGRLYGVSSKFAHWEPEVHLSFLTMGEEGSEVISRSIPHKICALLFFLGTASLTIECFISHVQRFYPDRDLTECQTILPKFRELASEIIQSTAKRANSDSLILEIAKAWI